jgi:hypothetical protein
VTERPITKAAMVACRRVSSVAATMDGEQQ